jgi:hypothetical protein
MFRPIPFALAALLVAAPAAAAEEENEWDGDFDYRAEVRSDVVLGLSVGLAFGSSSGYPNEAGKIDDPEYEADTGFALGQDYTVWVGGALQDWFTFALGVTSGGIEGDGLFAGSTGFLSRVETYPLFYFGDFWRDFAVFADFGIGMAAIVDVDTEDEVANGGALSLVGLGVAYEIWHLGGFAIGPTLQYRHLYSGSMRSDVGVLAARVSYYTGP